MEIYVKNYLISILSFFSGFQSWFCHIHWFNPCRSFRHSNWWRHKLHGVRKKTRYSIYVDNFV